MNACENMSTESALPDWVDPIRLARNASVMSGQLPIDRLDALREYHHSARLVHLRVEFSLDEAGRYVIQGTLELTVPLVCQRCLKSMEQTVRSRFALSPILDEAEALQLPANYEPILLEEGKISLFHLIEEEVLLNLPIVAKHDDSNCQLTAEQWTWLKEAGTYKTVAKTQAFAGLKELLSH